MSNMSYCRFQNTYKDLVDCLEALQADEYLSKSEEQYMNKILSVAEDFIDVGTDYENNEEES